MLYAIFASLLATLALADNSDCQYVLYLSTFGYTPLGINRCHYSVEKDESPTSMMFTCVNETAITMTTYSSSFDCDGAHTSYTVGSGSLVFDCTSSKRECGKLVGAKSPCDCTKENGDCNLAYAYSVVDDLCVTTGSTYYQQWDITCGSVSKAKLAKKYYSDSACNSYYGTELSYSAGCHTNSAYYSIFSSNEVDVIVCPGNFHAFSIALFVALIAAALSM